eukprot:Amastigsp_a678601_5.p3 type:complete len:239 gc:universal Amastigsp_a678601_5:1486-770(-)
MLPQAASTGTRTARRCAASRAPRAPNAPAVTACGRSLASGIAARTRVSLWSAFLPRRASAAPHRRAPLRTKATRARRARRGTFCSLALARRAARETTLSWRISLRACSCSCSCLRSSSFQTRPSGLSWSFSRSRSSFALSDSTRPTKPRRPCASSFTCSRSSHSSTSSCARGASPIRRRSTRCFGAISLFLSSRSWFRTWCSWGSCSVCARSLRAKSFTLRTGLCARDLSSLTRATCR